MEQTNGPTRLVWRDGEIIDWRDATIHVMSHVVHYGSSVFEGIRCYETPDGPAVFRLHDHMRRLADSARIYPIPFRHRVEDLCDSALELIVANGVCHCYLRPLVARTGEQMGVLADASFVEADDVEIVEPWVRSTSDELEVTLELARGSKDRKASDVTTARRLEQRFEGARVGRETNADQPITDMELGARRELFIQPYSK
jgi:branched-subunit amino acid aminotransferase/4-amino-4-deoxychorismate lyase